MEWPGPGTASKVLGPRPCTLPVPGHCRFQPGPLSGSESLHLPAGRHTRIQLRLCQDTRELEQEAQGSPRGHTLGARKNTSLESTGPALTTGSLARWHCSTGLCSVLCSVLCGTLSEGSWDCLFGLLGCILCTGAVFREPTQGWPAPPNQACLLIL